MTKILYIVTQGEWGGAQRYVYDLATNLKDGFEVLVAVGEKNGKNDLQNKIERLKDRKITIVQLQHLTRDISPVKDTLAIFELAKLYKTIRPDIVHLNSSKAGIIGSLAKLMAYGLGLNVIYTVHGWVFNEPNRWFGRWLYKFLEKLTARWKDKIIVLSEQDFLSGKQLGIPEEKLVKIPLGIEMPKFLDREAARRFLDPRWNLPPTAIGGGNDILVGTIANLYKTKGIDILVEAINLLERDSSTPPPFVKGGVARNDSVRFVVIGEGPERKSLENLIKKYHLENIVFLIGALDNAARYLPAFDLFILPSRKEGLPYTLLETMAQGIPIIATNTGGVPSLIRSGESGLLVEAEHPRRLANTILWAIDNPEEMKKHAERASENVKSLTIEKMVESTKTTYFSCLTPPRSLEIS